MADHESDTMRAVQIDSYGDISVLAVRDISRPTAGPGQVVVKVMAAAINPGESEIRKGGFSSDDDTFPMGEGSDLAGTISEAPDGSAWRVGDTVAGWSDDRAAHAQYAVVPENQLIRVPEGVSLDQAGSLYVAGGTASALQQALSPEAGQTVVVTAAAGGVGSILCQLLVHDGIKVIGLASEANHEYLSSLGVAPLSYNGDIEAAIRAAAPDGIAAFFDCYGNGYTDIGLRLTDQVATIADFEAAQQNDATLVFGYKDTTLDTIKHLVDLLADGSLVVDIASTYTLDDVQAAFTELEKRHTRGKIVLHPNG